MGDPVASRLTALSPEKRALLAKALAKKKKAPDPYRPAPPEPRSSPESPTRLTYAQQRLWFLDQLEPGAATYNMPIAVELRGPVAPLALQNTLQFIIDRHESLRIAVFDEAGKPSQRVRERLSINLPVQDLSQESPDVIERVIRAEAQLPFDIDRDPLIRAQLIKAAEERFVLLVTIHHIVADGWSIGNVFLKEFVHAYDAFSSGTAPDLPPLKIQYMDFAHWQEQVIQGAHRESLEDYWLNQLKGSPPLLDLPTDRPRPPLQTHRGAVHHFSFDANGLSAITEFAKNQRATLFMVALAAFGIVLGRLARQSDLTIGTPTAGRDVRGTDALIGLFVNSLAMRVMPEPELTVSEFIAKVRQTCLDGFKHQDMPFELLVDQIQPERDTSFSPIFQTMLILQNQNINRQDLKTGGVDLTSLPIDSGTAMFDLTLKLEEQAGELLGELEFNLDLFDPPTAALVTTYFKDVIVQLARSPDCLLSEISLAGTKSDEHVATISQHPHHTDFKSTVVDQFVEQAAYSPERVAVSTIHHKSTYGDLLEKVNEIASRLMTLALSPESRVGVCLQRTPNLISAIMGIMRAGLAYVPIDPNLPRERIFSMIRGGRISAFLTDDLSADRLPESELTVFNLDVSTEPIEAPAAYPEIHPDQLAYVIFTSGSTGQPKGVAISHRALSNFLEGMQALISLTKEDRLAAVTTISFDIAALEIFLPLIAGASIELVDRETAMDGVALARRLTDSSSTVLQATPATWRMLLDGQPKTLPIRRALCGGEALDAKLAGQMRAAGLAVINLYGPTETTIWSTACDITSPVSGAYASLGEPIYGTSLYVLDEELNPCGIGVPGELFIGGIGVSRGYTGQPALTAERFLPELTPRSAGQRMYRTGDLVVRRHDGRLDYIGRADFQVKIRGYRIELGEIESILGGHPAVQHAVALAKNTKAGPQLVAYIQPQPGYNLISDVGHPPSDQWQAVWQESYLTPEGEPDADDFSGWISSISGQAMDAEKMRRWADVTADRVLALSPENVLEVGCGTGLIASRIIGSLVHYTGVDFSPAAIRKTDTRLTAAGHKRFSLLESGADQIPVDDLTEVELIIINSVAQYFPSIEFLLRTISRLSGKLKPGGVVFLGDLRYLRFLDHLNSRILISKEDSIQSVEEFKRRLTDLRISEQELLLTPDALAPLETSTGRTFSISTLLKPEGIDEELRDFRYDLVLRFDEEKPDCWPSSALPEVRFRDSSLAIDVLESALHEHPKGFRVSQLPNSRLAATQRFLVGLAEARHDASLSDLLGSLHQKPESDSMQMYMDWAKDQDLEVALHWDSTDDGRLSAIFEKSTQGFRLNPYPIQETSSQQLSSNRPGLKSEQAALRRTLDDVLRQKLPDYMIPTAIVVLDQFPMTPNGKLDRLALPEPSSTVSRDTFIVPETPSEQLIAEVWKDLLGVPSISSSDRFFELGGHSLLAVQVIARLREKTGINIELQTLFDLPQLSELAKHIDTRPDRTPTRPLLTSRSEYERGVAPVTSQQRQLWFLEQISERRSAYHVSSVVKIVGQLNADALRNSLGLIVARHDSLRSNFVESASGVTRTIRDIPTFDWAHKTLKGSFDSKTTVDLVIRKPFDLSSDPLLRAHLFELGDAQHILVLVAHHIICDEWSIGVMQNELAEYYPQLATGKTLNVQPASYQYTDYSIWLEEVKRSEGYKESEVFWVNALADAPPSLELSTETSRPIDPTEPGAILHTTVGKGLLAHLSRLSLTTSTTLFMMLLTAWSLTLSRRSGSRDLVLGVPISDRSEAGLEASVGFFVNTLPIRISLEGNPSIEQLLQRVRRASLDAIKHRSVSFERIVELVQPERSLSTTPLYQSVFVMQNAPKAPLGFGGLDLEVLENDPGVAKFDLTLSVEEREDDIYCLFEYRRDLLSEHTVRAIKDEFEMYLEQIANDLSVAIDDVPRMRAETIDDFINSYKVDESELPPKDPLTWWNEQVLNNGTQPCIRYDGETISYTQVDQRVGQITHQLLAHGIRPGDVVAIFTEPSPTMVASVLAVLRTGATFLPLLPDLPKERMEYMLETTECTLVIDCMGNFPLINPKSIPPTAECKSIQASDTTRSYSSQIPAYVIFTSGSTGEPKPVVVSRENLGAFIASRLSFYSGMPKRLLLLQPFNFDVATGNIFWTLSAGGCLCLAPRSVAQDPHLMVQRIEQEEITHLVLLPLLYEPVLSLAENSQLRSLESVILGGEEMSATLALRHGELLPGVEIVNEYGPTEATVMCAAWTVDTTRQGGRHPIGRGTGYNRVYVLDDNLNLVQPGVAGELYISGPQVTQGYLNRAADTASAFIPDPFSGIPGARLYRTGDFGTFNQEGSIELLGRKDNQVKIRGNRIELGEISAAISRLSGVREVAIRPQAIGNTVRLVAYVVLQSGGSLTAEEIKQKLGDRLPDYMIPSEVIDLPGLPLTATGKLDVGKLPKTRSPQDAEHQPQTASEVKMQKVWKTVLGLEELGCRDNFFALGGDSILTIQVVSAARREGLEISARDLYQYQNIRDLCNAGVRTVRQASEYLSEPVTFKLTPIQQWFMERHHDKPNHFNQSLLLRLSKDLDDESLRSALEKMAIHHSILSMRLDSLTPSSPARYAEHQSIPLKTIHVETLEAIPVHAEDLQSSLDLVEGPICRVCRFVTPSKHDRLLLVIHHMAIDGVSWRILIDHLNRLLQTPDAPLPQRTTGYGAWSRHLRTRPPPSPKTIEHWLSVPSAQNVLMKPESSEQTPNLWGEEISFRHILDEALTERLLRTSASALAVTLNEVVLTAVHFAFAELSSQETIGFTLEGHGRNLSDEGPDISETLGWFTAPYPVVLSADPNTAPGDRLRRHRETLKRVPNSGADFGILRYQSDDPVIRAQLATSEHQSVSFNYLGHFNITSETGPLLGEASESVGRDQALEGGRPHLIDINCYISDRSFHFSWTFCPEIHTPRQIEKLACLMEADLNRVCDLAELENPIRVVCPSDFPFVDLSWKDLDDLVDKNSEANPKIYPLSAMQQGMLIQSQKDPSGGSYVVQLACEIHGTFDSAVFKSAWQETINDFDLLRGAVRNTENGHMVLMVMDEVTLDWTETDWRAFPKSEQLTRYSELIRVDREKAFSTDNPPLMRWHVIQLSEQKWRFVWSQHHTISDGWSLPLIVDRALERYDRLLTNDGPDRKLTPADYEQYLRWLSAQDQATTRAFWSEYLSSVAEPSYIGQFRTTDTTEQFFSERLFLSEEVSDSLRSCAGRLKTTLNALVETTLGVLIARWTHRNQAIFGTTVSGRPADVPGIESMVGMFINTVPTRIRWDAKTRLSDLLEAHRTHQIARFSHEQIALTESVSLCDLPQRVRPFDCLCVFENYPVADALQQDAHQIRMESVEVFEQTDIPATLTIQPERAIMFQLATSTHFFEETFSSIFLGSLKALLIQLNDSIDLEVDEWVARALPSLDDAIEQLRPGRPDLEPLSLSSTIELPFEHPATDTEQKVASHLSAVLQIESPSRHDDFFALGGHSLLAARLAGRLSGDFGFEIAVGEIFKKPTIKQLSDLIDAQYWALGEDRPAAHDEEEMIF